MSNTSYETLTKAQLEVERLLLDDHAHTIYIGEKDGKPAIVVEVQHKLPTEMVVSQGLTLVPKWIEIDGVQVPTDVIENPPIKPLLLRTGSRVHGPQAAMPNQECFDCPIPGGAQMAPEGADWVGTIGCGLSFIDPLTGDVTYGAVTNHHVAVKPNARVGDRMFQPWLDREWFGRLAAWQKLQYINGNVQPQNRVDMALLNCRRTDAKYAPVTDTVSDELIGIGQYDPNPILSVPVNQLVMKSGRTTGVTKGRVVGINATSRVQYDEGVALFVGQLLIRGDTANFSLPGDSGSLIVSSLRRPVGLLFAGGGGTTLANPIKDVIAFGKCRFYGQA